MTCRPYELAPRRRLAPPPPRRGLRRWLRFLAVCFGRR
jgi:hypothetical protein